MFITHVYVASGKMSKCHAFFCGGFHPFCCDVSDIWMREKSLPKFCCAARARIEMPCLHVLINGI